MAPGNHLDRRRVLWMVERTLLVIGLFALGWYAAVHILTRLDQASQSRTLERLRAERPAPATPTSPSPTPEVAVPPPAPKRPRPEPNALIGRVEIPRLRLSAIVREGVDDGTLRRAVGHVPETALPGEHGNAALAAHRDTFFRPLKEIRKGDRINVTTPDGTYEYRVHETRIVDPEDVWVLDPTREPTLTLVTCYPFNYVGSAPRRFIVRATASAPASAAAPPTGSAPPATAAPAPAVMAPGRRSLGEGGALPSDAAPQQTAMTTHTATKVSVRKASASKKSASRRPPKKDKPKGWRKFFGIFVRSDKNVGS